MGTWLAAYLVRRSEALNALFRCHAVLNGIITGQVSSWTHRTIWAISGSFPALIGEASDHLHLPRRQIFFRLGRSEWSTDD